jgi:hypothetical protein
METIFFQAVVTPVIMPTNTNPTGNKFLWRLCGIWMRLGGAIFSGGRKFE